MISTLSVRTGLFVGTVVLTMACSQPAPVESLNTSREGPSGSVDTPQADYPALSNTDILYPTVEFFARGQSSAELSNEVEQAVSQCMQQRGWTYEPVLQDAAIGDPRTVGELRRYRETYGYGEFSFPEDENPELGISAADRNATFIGTLSSTERDRYLTDLNGGVADVETSMDDDEPLPGTCMSDARVAATAPLYDLAVMNDMRDLYQASLTAPALVEAKREWRECMASEGYNLVNPIDAYHLAVAEGQSLPGDQATLREVEIAVDDFNCRLATTMPVEHYLEEQVVRTLIERYPEYGAE